MIEIAAGAAILALLYGVYRALRSAPMCRCGRQDCGGGCIK